jgi:hypothetical protein
MRLFEGYDRVKIRHLWSRPNPKQPGNTTRATTPRHRKDMRWLIKLSSI